MWHFLEKNCANHFWIRNLKRQRWQVLQSRFPHMCLWIIDESAEKKLKRQAPFPTPHYGLLILSFYTRSLESIMFRSVNPIGMKFEDSSRLSTQICFILLRCWRWQMPVDIIKFLESIHVRQHRAESRHDSILSHISDSLRKERESETFKKLHMESADWSSKVEQIFNIANLFNFSKNILNIVNVRTDLMFEVT